MDDGNIAFNLAVELSYLDSYQQRVVPGAMVLNGCVPYQAQSIRLKKLAQESGDFGSRWGSVDAGENG